MSSTQQAPVAPAKEKQDVSESSPLSETMRELSEGYGLGSHATFKPTPTLHEPEHESLVDYEPAKLSTFRVFCAIKGTIREDPVLYLEQLIITLIFVCCAAPTYHYFNADLLEGHGGKGITLRRWLVGQEGKMRSFAMIMTTLAAFLLSFYTSICVARWWVMRTAGVGGIKAATVDLEWLLYQNVTQEEKYLSAIRRYGRTSLMLIFLWRQNGLDPVDLKRELVSRELLTEEEADKLLVWKHCLHETIWAWQGQIVTTLNNQGKIKSDILFTTLLQKCTEGRQAVQCVHTHLAVRVPMQYVHMLGLLVKMHNLILSIIMGILFGGALQNGRYVLCFQTFARTLILPFLFNAILLINCDLSDPFSGSTADFPGIIYQGALEKDCKGFVEASQNMPDWVISRHEKV